MFSLKNESLEVLILDPEADRDRFRTRYCVGGYIFQIDDAQHGSLLSGPTYPESFNTYDGQGIPDAFNLNPLREPGKAGTSALIIGIGLCDLEADHVIEFSTWNVQRDGNTIRMRTEQSFQVYALELERAVTLSGRTIRTSAWIKNTGRTSIPIRWFPHPFFPHPETDELCQINAPISFPENDGYEMDESGFIHRKNWPWTGRNYYQALDHDMHENLAILQRHPSLGLIAATCSYTPRFFPIWGNEYTFSWEPFFEQSVAPGQEVSWGIDYHF